MRIRPPATVLVYVAKWVTILAVALVAATSLAAALAVAAVMAILLVGLWRGSRAAWALLLLVEVVALLSAPLEQSAWWVAPLSVFALGLLLAPPSRRHVLPR